eukprot:TRINITY_DN56562_c0_g1_i1.p1 TRINITY_DN56562_c0_g1~~TRINITY_DN56562_c0_g1_i1.p1  ORF type:complete len:118 (+),score=11.85 TRINITY_DN56562_c0_g1_i1:52-354(+)
MIVPSKTTSNEWTSRSAWPNGMWIKTNTNSRHRPNKPRSSSLKKYFPITHKVEGEEGSYTSRYHSPMHLQPKRPPRHSPSPVMVCGCVDSASSEESSNKH